MPDENQYRWASLNGELMEPAEIEYQDGKPVRIWFIGTENYLSADDCEIGEQIIRGQS